MTDASAPQVDAVVVGAGFGGLYLVHRLRQLGFTVQAFERGGDVGGTWYWNRYPGARCDVESIDYSYSFDEALEQEWTWSERFATQPEILAYLRHVADRFDLRPAFRFETTVDSARWDEGAGNWSINTSGGEWRARFLILATGSLSAAKTPDIPGLDEFSGTLLSTAAWPAEGHDFSGERVGVIGTGSSAIQVIPLVAQRAAHLTVFQRTPSFTVPARNRPLSEQEIADIKARYREHRRSVRETRPGVHFLGSGRSAHDVDDAERERQFEKSWTHGGPGFAHAFNDLAVDIAANAHAADFVRAKIADTVRDPAVARKLSPTDYPIGAKRIAVDTDYFETFNRPNVQLKDLRETPMTGIVADGVATSDGVTPLDTLILATGFDAMTGSFLRVDIRGIDGKSLSDAWRAGPTTYLGLAVAGFPNLFLIAGPGSPSVLTNMVLSIEQHVDWVADCMVNMRDNGQTRIEAEPAAQEQWVERVNQAAAKTLFLQADSWYLGANVPGKPRVFMPFVGGVALYRKICDAVVADDYRGFLRQ